MTGLRQGELLGLRWIDLDMRAFKVRVRQAYVRGEFTTPKSRRGTRGVPMADRLVEALEDLAARTSFRDDDDLVFGHPETGEPLDRSRVRKRFQRACRRAGVRVVRFHDLRHTFGTRVAASGEVSLRTLQEWMGHRDGRTTLIYADYQPGEHEAELVSRAIRSRLTYYGIPSRSFADDVHNALCYAASVFERIGYAGRLATWVRIENAEKAELLLARDWDVDVRHPRVEWVGAYREIGADELRADPTPTARDAMDRIWQGFGLPRCFLFDESGSWR
jgi:hypothetical protein